MGQYRDAFPCSACGAGIIVRADTRAQHVGLTRFLIRCPTCRSELEVTASYDVYLETLEVLAYDRKPGELM
jgi:Zn finger protein HypA/HybF involved in hydrogenase expression